MRVPILEFGGSELSVRHGARNKFAEDPETWCSDVIRGGAVALFTKQTGTKKFQNWQLSIACFGAV